MNTHCNPSDDAIREILTSVKTIALIGASDKPERASHRVMRTLLKQGYRVYPVNPRLAGQSVHGERVYARLGNIPEAVDMVDIFRRPSAAVQIVEQAILKGVRVVWMQLGVINQEAADKAAAAGLTVVMDRCPAIEGPRLGLWSR